LSDKMGAGSMTGLPIIETKANDVSAFIPTNVISITDGQIFLQSDLFAANQRPAIDVGVSVSRVGGSAMTKAMKVVTGSLKVDLAQFRAMEAFAMFASDLDAASRQQLDRGQRLMALLKQKQYSPYPVEEMTVSLWTGTSGRLDRLSTEDVLRFEAEFLDFLRRSHSKVLTGIRESRKFDDATASALEAAYDEFLGQFETSDGQSVMAGHEEHEAMGDDSVEQEQIVVQKKKG
jgi:F-type H+/Na+-transporting ATPase subunit alpha